MSWREEQSLGDPGVVDLSALGFFQRWIAPIVRLAFRPRLVGLENLPTSGPYLLVANHSGLGVAEELALVERFSERMAFGQTIASMVHPISFNTWPASRFVRAFGSIPSTYAAAEAALARGIPVLVFPGGDHEVMRPVWQADRVDFAGRQGFLKIAHRTKVPIVPMGIRGSHYTTPVLWRSERVLSALLVFPRLLGGRRFPLTLAAVLGAVAIFALGPMNIWVTLALAYLWIVLPISQLPWIPASITITIGKPITHEQMFGRHDDAPNDASIDAAYVRVIGAVQELVVRRTAAAHSRWADRWS